MLSTLVMWLWAATFQLIAMACSANAWKEHGLYIRNPKVRNRWIFGAVVASVAALLTAHVA